MKWIYTVVLWSVLVPVAMAQNNFMVKNGWTNTLAVSFYDLNGSNLCVFVPVGGQFVAQCETGTAFQLFDPSTYDTNTSLYDQRFSTAGDGSTNDLFLQTFALGGPVFSLGVSVAQYRGAVSDVAGFTFPPVSDCIYWWFWGVCTSIILGLSGASRRLLGRVHEVNTDL